MGIGWRLESLLIDGMGCAQRKAPGLKNRGLNERFAVEQSRAECYAGARTWMLTLRTMSFTIAR